MLLPCVPPGELSMVQRIYLVLTAGAFAVTGTLDCRGWKRGIRKYKTYISSSQRAY